MNPTPEYKYQFRNGQLVKVADTTEDVSKFWKSCSSMSAVPIDSVAATPGAVLATPMVRPTHGGEKLPDFKFPSTSSSGKDTKDQDEAKENTKIGKADDGPNPSSQNTTVNNTANECPQSTDRMKISRQELFKRDNEAVQYTKSLLAEGDTLVYIKYPGKCYDSTGFAISDEPHRVHSSFLLATGSKVFADLLGPTNQYRILRRKKLVHNLPPGIKFVIDLTPPEEGDVAVDLTVELSCSLGIRMWYTAEQRCHIPAEIVGGRDAVTAPPPSASSPTSVGSANYNLGSSVSGQNQSNSSSRASDPPRTTSPVSADSDFDEAIRMTKEESLKPQIFPQESRDVLEYCPIRHRLGIANLLQIIERKDVKLDSAPKIWTLFVLAKYFDCGKLVIDYIVTWMLSRSNTQFIEILPEMSCRIGLGLQIPIITRAAFSILVGEEALSLASRRAGSFIADTQGRNQFGRLRENIDEDLQTCIEYASKDFHERIVDTWNNLTEENMSWFHCLPEYQKLSAFEQAVSDRDGYQIKPLKTWQSNAAELSVALRYLVRDRLNNVLLFNDLTNTQVVAANQHRVAENYTSNTIPTTFSLVWKCLGARERIFTRFLWTMVRDIEFSSHSRTKNNVFGVDGSLLIGTLAQHQLRLNNSVLEAISLKYYADGIMPLEATTFHQREQATDEYGRPIVRGWHTAEPKKAWDPEPSSQVKSTVELPIRPRLDSATALETVDPPQRGHQESEWGWIEPEHKKPVLFKPSLKEPRVPSDWDMPGNSPFFNLTQFLVEVSSYICSICNQMLDSNEVGFDLAVTDTLVCLGPEFKFLPLWAGGDDDGSGGVFDPTIPAAQAGPSGPGPSFHTGLSNASRPSSEFGYSERTSFNTSVGVEDGFSSHIDRRRVIADDDFHSETFSDDSTTYDRKGKGIDRSGFAMSHTPSVASSATLDRDFVSVGAGPSGTSIASSATAEDEVMSYGGFSDSATETGADSVDEAEDDTDSLSGEADVEQAEDEWDEGDTESFDFGDSDEEMVMV